jgi:hypothetical protein
MNLFLSMLFRDITAVNNWDNKLKQDRIVSFEFLLGIYLRQFITSAVGT